MHEALRTFVERRIERLKQEAPYTQRVREVLMKQGRPPPMSMDTVARSLGISVRSLRRRLASEQTSYYEIERDALVAAAKDMLRNGLLTIQEIADKMGFSSSAAFHHAFKRWMGVTPTVYRNGRS
jgi:AraC-like DNA-binding protein